MKNRENVAKKSNSTRLIVITIAAVLVCACVGIVCWVLNSGSPKYDEAAEQFAQYEFGAVPPRICYADAETVTLYDAHGVVVYNIEDEKICGVALFEEIGPVELQGSAPTFVNASADGRHVYVYSEEGEKYLYDVLKDKFEKVEAYDSKFETSISQPEVFKGNVTPIDGVYSIGDVFQCGDDGYCYLAIKTPENEENTNYSDIRLVVNKDGVQKEYAVFK